MQCGVHADLALKIILILILNKNLEKFEWLLESTMPGYCFTWNALPNLVIMYDRSDSCSKIDHLVIICTQMRSLNKEHPCCPKPGELQLSCGRVSCTLHLVLHVSKT